ncbi:MAG: UDP-glucose 4-epimerase GalE [Firmicutes bacterium]|nr:UDP-glucose 4-epimerase GalE [Bacillota bacterium]
MNILVCGGAGYIGSHTVKKLLENNYDVTVLDNLEKGHEHSVKDVSLFNVNLLNKDNIDKIFINTKIDAVMHFAANSIVGESMERPEVYYNNNVVGTLNLLEIMQKHTVSKLIFSSTAAVYGAPKEIPITENHPKEPTNCYGATKLAVESMLNWFSHAYGLNYVSLRYFNAAGASKQGDIGEDHEPETHLIPLVLRTALGLRPEIKIFGTDYSTPDGTCVRDYIHVDDLADAHVLSLEYLLKGGHSTVFNLGNGKGFSVLEVINTAQRVVGKPIQRVYAERRSGDPAVLVASSDKIKKELGWTPKYTDLYKIIETAWNWHNKHPNGFGD